MKYVVMISGDHNNEVYDVCDSQADADESKKQAEELITDTSAVKVFLLTEID